MEFEDHARWRGLVGPALRSFFRLAEVWHLDEHEQMKLLGLTDNGTLRRWESGSYVDVRSETIKRISYLLGIFGAINILVPEQTHADSWMRTSNMGTPFGGRSALDRMTDGHIDDLRAVRQYLDAQLG
jgi:hypothetical protein